MKNKRTDMLFIALVATATVIIAVAWTAGTALFIDSAQEHVTKD
jgi:hypothetical protein